MNEEVDYEWKDILFLESYTSRSIEYNIYFRKLILYAFLLKKIIIIF